MAYSDVLGIKQLEASIMKACIALESQAVQLAPVDQGALRNSISIATELREQGFNTQGGDQAPSDAKITPPKMDTGGTAYVGTGIVYGAAVEYGRPDMPSYPAQPYLRPAANVVKTKMAGEFTKELKAEIKKLANERNHKLRG